MMRLVGVQGVQSSLPTVASELASLQAVAADARAVQQALTQSKPASLDAERLRRELAFLARTVAEAQVRLASLGVFAVDVEAGTVEFPTLLGGEVVHLVADVRTQTVTHVRRLVGTGDIVPCADVPQIAHLVPRPCDEPGGQAQA